MSGQPVAVTARTFQVTDVRTQDVIPDHPVRFERCVFVGCRLAPLADATKRLVVSGVEVKNCDVRGGFAEAVWFKDCLVDRVKMRSSTRINGCVFEHVVLRGKIAELMIKTRQHPQLQEIHGPAIYERPSFINELDHAYRTIDWALDITGLDCQDLTLYGIPSRLIRRDPQRHFVISLEAARSMRWKHCDFGESWYEISIKRLLDRHDEDTLIVLPTRGTRVEACQRAITELRAADMLTE